MKKIYMTPAVQVEKIQLASMLAESLSFGKTTVDGDKALTNDNPWDNIWGDEEEF